MDKLLAVLCFIVCLAVIIFAFPEGNVAFLALVSTAGITFFFIKSRSLTDEPFIIRIFLIGLLARVLFGLLIHVFELREFFGGDAETYDLLAHKITQVWFEGVTPEEIYTNRDLVRLRGIGYGMSYLLAAIYSIFGRNILAAQFIYAVVGSAIAPLIYTCSFKIFKNRRAAQVAGILAAVYPAFIIWTGQLLKDG